LFRVPLLVALALIVAFGGGITSAIWALKATVGFGSIAIGPWVAFPEAQTVAADPYAKAHRARVGELLYGGAEGLKFTAATDDTGARLSAACSYDVSGITPPARFWTLYTATTDGATLRAKDSSFVIHASPAAQPDNWLAIRHTGNFQLVLTLLDTPTAGSSGLIDLAMPKIVKTGCGNA
jgi:hypothetical protein